MGAAGRVRPCRATPGMDGGARQHGREWGGGRQGDPLGGLQTRDGLTGSGGVMDQENPPWGGGSGRRESPMCSSRWSWSWVWGRRGWRSREFAEEFGKASMGQRDVPGEGCYGARGGLSGGREFCGKTISVGHGISVRRGWRGCVERGLLWERACCGAGTRSAAPPFPPSQTTIMAVEFDGGVVIGADSRTTTG